MTEVSVLGADVPCSVGTGKVARAPIDYGLGGERRTERSCQYSGAPILNLGRLPNLA